MKILIVGSGGREHALAWKLCQSPLASRVFCAPGNDGMRGVTLVPTQDPREIVGFAARERVDLTVVGPEVPLCDGIVDRFRQRGLPICGPTAAAARLEGSKAFAKTFMRRYGIPTAQAEVFTDRAEAGAYLRRVGAPIVVKADGLAAGKGVIVAATEAQAMEALTMCFDGRFGEAGRTVVIEECLAGEEASIIALTDGNTITPLAVSQDHKRIGDGDTGPNTGGMGAYSPAPVVTPALMAEIRAQVLEPFLAGCQAEQLDYRGIIYAGIMVTPHGIRVLEFNVRFGDPETQAILPRLESDLAEALLATVQGRLATADLRWAADPAVCVVMAAGGYPGSYNKGAVISGLEEAEATGAVVFHAGTQRVAGRYQTHGGRVLGVTARGPSMAEAVANAYRGVDCIHWEGAYCRRDIARRALVSAAST